MKLLTKTIEQKLPPLYFNEDKKPHEIPVPLKIFDPCSNATWYIYEYDPKQRLGFGVCFITDPELGYVSFEELESYKGRWGLGLERDRWWEGKTLADVAKLHNMNWLLEEDKNENK